MFARFQKEESREARPAGGFCYAEVPNGLLHSRGCCFHGSLEDGMVSCGRTLVCLRRSSGSFLWVLGGVEIQAPVVPAEVI